MSSREPSISEMQKFFGGSAVEWIPELWDASESGSEGQTYNATYTKGTIGRLGNRCEISGRIIMTGLGTLSTAITIGNLPYTPIATGNSPVTLAVVAGLNLASGESLDAYVSVSSNKIVLRTVGISGSANTDISEIAASFDVMFSAVYYTDDDF